MKEKKKIVLFSTTTFIIGIILSLLIVYSFPNFFKKTLIKEERNVTITDTGLSEAVDKVYNKVALISNYQNDKLVATGSGFIYKVDNNDTYIITNHHVISDSNVYKVTYSDNTTLDATLVGSDEYTDIAVLKVKTIDGFEGAEISSDDIKAGDTVFALGSPLDNAYSFTVTRGIISGKERLVEISNNNDNILINVIQTDAAVNSGNSGGPLCNANGQVIGVVNAKLSGTGIEGIGFAIPISTATEKADEIIDGKTIEYPYVGISIVSVEDAINDFRYSSYIKNNNNINEGIIVLSVEKSSPAYGKLKENDIITKIDNVSISDVARFRYELYKHSINDEINVTYIRNGEEKTIKIKLSKKNSNI